jgi:hypothetical protein
LSLLRVWGVELCLTIVGPSQVRCHLSVRMQAAAHLHVGMARELTALRAVVCSTVELVLGRPADEPSVTPPVL